MFISRPTHARSQWELERVRMVPNPRADRRQEVARGCISKGGVIRHFWGMGPRAFVS